MAININPNRVNISAGSAGKSLVGQKFTENFEQKTIIPTRATENNIPAPETLSTLIRSAISAMRSGIFWDRGTILNLSI